MSSSARASCPGPAAAPLTASLLRGLPVGSRTPAKGCPMSPPTPAGCASPRSGPGFRPSGPAPLLGVGVPRRRAGGPRTGSP
eukprot:2440914-Pyramimonas_sp.AAC.1